MSCYYLSPHDKNIGRYLFNLNDIHFDNISDLDFQKNNFALFLQSYQQAKGTTNTDGEIQDNAIGLIGIELDHYFTDQLFWWLKASGAFSGIPNGYMDILGGLGYRWTLKNCDISFIPQLGVGAGGGGMVDTGGGSLINPLFGVEWHLFSRLYARLSTGYLWALTGDFKAVPVTGELVYHLDIPTQNQKHSNYLIDYLKIQGWRVELLNQTYVHPQRQYYDTRTSINLVGMQIDQLFTEHLLLSYQGFFAYSGYHAGGFATGMIGPGIQSSLLFNQHLQLFSTLLFGAGGGGGLSLGGGSLIEPVIGFRYLPTPILGLEASASQIKAINDNLNTPAFNLGISFRFDLLSAIDKPMPPENHS